MSSIAVDLEGLAALASDLVGAGEQLCGAGRALRLAGAGTAGPGGLAAAVDDFCEAWTRGLRETGEAAQLAGEQLRRAAAAYAQVECVVTRACA
jgi:hypothetical protein